MTTSPNSNFGASQFLDQLTSVRAIWGCGNTKLQYIVYRAEAKASELPHFFSKTIDLQLQIPPCPAAPLSHTIEQVAPTPHKSTHL